MRPDNGVMDTGVMDTGVMDRGATGHWGENGKRCDWTWGYEWTGTLGVTGHGV